MATLTPGMWKHIDPRSHPDDIRRERSGFWSHEYRMDNDEHVWRCDLHKMHEAVRDVLMNPREFDHFSKDPHRYLDLVFGEGTARAYFTKHPANDHYMNYRMSREMQRDRYMGIDPARGRDEMAYFSGTTWTDTSTTGTGGTSGQWHGAGHKSYKKKNPKSYKPAVPPRSIMWPFQMPAKINGEIGMVNVLQGQFDRRYGDQMKELFA